MWFYTLLMRKHEIRLLNLKYFRELKDINIETIYKSVKSQRIYIH